MTPNIFSKLKAHILHMYQLSASISITDSLEVENIKKDEMTAMTTGTTTNETSEAENNTESYSIAGTYLILDFTMGQNPI
jgi:hypothetical protein